MSELEIKTSYEISGDMEISFEQKRAVEESQKRWVSLDSLKALLEQQQEQAEKNKKMCEKYSCAYQINDYLLIFIRDLLEAVARAKRFRGFTDFKRGKIK